MASQNRPDDLGTFIKPFVFQKGLDLLIFNEAPTNPWTYEITDDPNSGPASTLISGPSIPYTGGTLYNFAEQPIDIDSVVLVPGARYNCRILDNTMALVTEGLFTVFELDVASGPGSATEINDLVKVGLGLHGENARLVNDVVEFGVPTTQTLTIYTDNTLVTPLEIIDMKRYLDEAHRVVAEVSRLRA